MAAFTAEEESAALAIGLSLQSTPADGGFCTFQPVFMAMPAPGIRLPQLDKFAMSGTDLVYWHRKHEQWRLLAGRAPTAPPPNGEAAWPPRPPPPAAAIAARRGQTQDKLTRAEKVIRPLQCERGRLTARTVAEGAKVSATSPYENTDTRGFVQQALLVSPVGLRSTP